MNWTEFFTLFTIFMELRCEALCLSEVNDAWTAGRSLTVNHMVACKRSPVFLRVNTKRPNIDKRDPCILMTVYIPLCKEDQVDGKSLFFLKTTVNVQCFQTNMDKKQKK